MNWYDLPEPKIQWLIDGLFTADGHAAIAGKPKAGKSTLVRNLVAAVVKGGKFLGRSVDLPPNTGRVLYVHLDRKDRDWRVAKELRQLGITQQDSKRLVLRTADDVKAAETFEDRLAWLKKEVINAAPHLVVIDLLWQFVVARNANDYNEVLGGINKLQDALRECKYAGALIVTLHGRKANSPNDQFDDVLGSTGQRGSFGTMLMLTHRRAEGVYTVSSDQTDRDDVFGEIGETVIERGPDGMLQLGLSFADVIQSAKKNKSEEDLQRLLAFLDDYPGAELPAIMDGLAMAKKTVLRLFEKGSGLLRREGAGIKGDPFRYFIAGASQQLEGDHDH